MVRTSTHQDEKYDIYECHVVSKHVVTSGEATANAIVVTGVEAHAVVIADEEYARGYADGAPSAITGVTYTGSDTTVAFTSLIEGETVDIYFPLTGTASGSLVSNTNTGKLTLPRIQAVQKWNVDANMEKVSECGTERRQPIEFAPGGTVVLGLNRYGNMAMADFIAAKAGSVVLLIDVVDTTTTTTHDILHEAKVRLYKRASRAENSMGGIVTDAISFSFKPDVVTL